MLITKLLELKNRLVKALRELRAATHARDSDHFKMPRIYKRYYDDKFFKDRNYK